MVRSILFFAFLIPAVAIPQTTTGVLSGLPKHALQTVRKSGYKVLVPTVIPRGFKLVKWELMNHMDPGQTKKNPALTDWRLRYENAHSRAEIVVQMASDGLGDYIFDMPDGDTVEPLSSLKAKSPALGSFAVMVAKKGSYRAAATTWIELKTKGYPKYLMVYGNGVEGTAVKRVAESLRWLK